jgi:hypothetical protein
MSYGKGRATFAKDYAEEKGELNKGIIESNEYLQDYQNSMDTARLGVKAINFFFGGGAGTETILTGAVEGIGEMVYGNKLQNQINDIDAFDHTDKKFSSSFRHETAGEVDNMVDTLRSTTRQDIGKDMWSTYKSAGGITPGTDKITADDVADYDDLTDDDIGKYFTIGKGGTTTHDSFWDYLISKDAWRFSGN